MRRLHRGALALIKIVRKMLAYDDVAGQCIFYMKKVRGAPENHECFLVEEFPSWNGGFLLLTE